MKTAVDAVTCYIMLTWKIYNFLSQHDFHLSTVLLNVWLKNIIFNMQSQEAADIESLLLDTCILIKHVNIQFMRALLAFDRRWRDEGWGACRRHWVCSWSDAVQHSQPEEQKSSQSFLKGMPQFRFMAEEILNGLIACLKKPSSVLSVWARAQVARL